jgi:hypothetical protein
MPKVKVVGLSRESVAKAKNIEEAVQIHNNLLKDKDTMAHLEKVMTFVQGFITRVASDTEFEINTNGGPVQRLLTAHPAPGVQQGQYIRAYFLKANHAHYQEISRGRLVDGKLALLIREQFNDTEQPYKINSIDPLTSNDIEPPVYFDEHYDIAKITSV